MTVYRVPAPKHGQGRGGANVGPLRGLAAHFGRRMEVCGGELERERGFEDSAAVQHDVERERGVEGMDEQHNVEQREDERLHHMAGHRRDAQISA